MNSKYFFIKKIHILLFSLPFLIVFIANNSLGQEEILSKKINLDWEVVNSYVFPFYEGLPLPGEESLIKAVANVQIKTPAGDLDPKKLFYAWRYNDYYLYNYSKTGGSSVLFNLDSLESVNSLKLEVYTNNRQEILLGEKTINIRPRPSLPLIYRDDENHIIKYANAINKKYEAYRVENGETVNMYAEPLYMSISNTKDKNLDYVWSKNNIPSNTNSGNMFDLVLKGDIKNLNINLKISNNLNLLQEGETSIQFKY